MALNIPNSGSTDLAHGWAQMLDEHGAYYINLYSKEVSRIRPVRASVFDEDSLPPPPPSEEDDNPDPLSRAISDPLSPNSQQQAIQQQIYNQQLYQQQWQQYYAQANAQQALAQQQWQYQQQLRNGMAPYQYHHQQHSTDNTVIEYQNEYHQPQQDEEEDEEEDEDESSLTDYESDSSSSAVATEFDEEEQRRQSHQIQPQIQPKPVPPIKEDSAYDQQYKFQPILPPQISIESMKSSMDSIKDLKGVGLNKMPSAAFNPNKISNMMGVNVDVDDAVIQKNVSAVEGNDVHKVPVPLKNQVADVKAAPPNPIINNQESMIFGVMLQHADKKKHLKKEENWEMLCDGIQSNCPLQDQYDVFKAMRKVAKNLLMDDEKYMTLYADNDMVQKKILGRVGGYEFLRGIGFKQGNDDNELIVAVVDRTIVSNAITVLQKRIESLRKTRHEWDPKFKKKKIVVNAQPKQQQKLVDDEQRQLEEAIALSQQQHIQDMLARQQKELDLAEQIQKAKSINMYAPHQEDDHKAVWM